MNDKVSVNLSVTVEDLLTRERVIGHLNDAVRNLIGYDVEFSMSSYKVEDDVVDPNALADWERELLEGGHDHKKCEADLKKPGFAYQIEPDESDRMGVARSLASDMLNDVDGLNYPASDFKVLSFVVTDDGWKVFLFLPARPDKLYVVSRDIKTEESTVLFFGTEHSCVITG